MPPLINAISKLLIMYCLIAGALLTFVVFDFDFDFDFTTLRCLSQGDFACLADKRRDSLPQHFQTFLKLLRLLSNENVRICVRCQYGDGRS